MRYKIQDTRYPGLDRIAVLRLIEIWPAMPADNAHVLRAVILFALTRPVTLLRQYRNRKPQPAYDGGRKGVPGEGGLKSG